ncbi:FixH family protein [Croceicoccus naphthovorans]|uniref:Membrane protein n=1 Tax=Croceicoccus naphthovorans TaxID=1348774 RepID=A0A0G3XEE3_9SPHN|nr:FixH family protein [Croceicoccus naphthovorans]AKM09522.1 membrane protein [Croceicoccus naphthovorans]MBB3989731.1 nitrogen fixation protein FixH [Croceicoccus naphthovorans]
MQTHSKRRPKSFTGRHMAAVMVVGFGIVIAVNFTMAALASSSFGGVVVENSYVASQNFNGWLDRAEKSEALGYSVEASRGADGRVVLATANVPAGSQVIAVARHPLGHQPETELAFVQSGHDAWTSTAALPEGRWTLRILAKTGPDEWRGERALP